MRKRNTPIFQARTLRNSVLYLVALATSFFLSACAGPPTSQAQNPKPPEREYMVYRIDDHRYITIESRYPCINGQIDGKIYYYDTRQNIRTAVAYTGDADNGLYRGYYAIHADSSYVAIPSLSFSQTSGMKLRINYSHDGGRTFQWFRVGDYNPKIAILVNNNNLILSTTRSEELVTHFNSSGVLFDISQDMDPEIAHFTGNISVFGKYGKDVYEVPTEIQSPSGQTRWTCPVAPEQ
jgi:hypothetical protein